MAKEMTCMLEKNGCGHAQLNTAGLGVGGWVSKGAAQHSV